MRFWQIIFLKGQMTSDRAEFFFFITKQILFHNFALPDFISKTICHMKVVILRTYYRVKKMVFLLPRSQYEVYDHKIWGEKTSDDPFQVSNVNFLGGWACGQHVLTKVTKVGKNGIYIWREKLIYSPGIIRFLLSTRSQLLEVVEGRLTVRLKVLMFLSKIPISLKWFS